MQNAVFEHSDEADTIGVDLDVRLEPCPTVGDPQPLAQLASNLIQNAIRHNVAAGTALITSRHDGPNARILLQVENTCVFFTQEIAAQLSEPFLRGSGRINRSAQSKKGYGLGLALVARITEVHHGTLVIAPRTCGGLII